MPVKLKKRLTSIIDSSIQFHYKSKYLLNMQIYGKHDDYLPVKTDGTLEHSFIAIDFDCLFDPILILNYKSCLKSGMDDCLI